MRGSRPKPPAFVAGNDAPLSTNGSQCAGEAAMEGGDGRASVKSALTNSSSSLVNRIGGENLARLPATHQLKFDPVCSRQPGTHAASSQRQR